MTRKIIPAIAAIAALIAVAAPAVSSAAPVVIGTRVAVTTQVDYRDHGRFGGGFDNRASAQIDRRIADLDSRINGRGRHDGLSYRETARLNDRLNNIRSDKRRDERDGRGLDGREVASLNARLDDLSNSVFGQRHDRNGW